MKPSLPQGTRDFSPEVVRKRHYILNTIKTVFELYGFQPLETPAMENMETLMGKYGEEGDKLIFRVLESGNPFSESFIEAYYKPYKNSESYVELNNFFIELLKEVQKSSKEYNTQAKEYVQKFCLPLEGPFDIPFYALNPEVVRSISNEILSKEDFNNKYLPELKSQISKKALRYDLTIPFARYVAMNHGQLNFPFKRYQIQPVWRADRPQRGRYREFYQCDADVVGSKSLLNEVELTNIYATVFDRLNIPVEIRLNSRKILAALAEVAGGSDKLTDITVAIDKLDKIGLEKVKEELRQRGLDEAQVQTIENYLNINGTNQEKLAKAKDLFHSSETGSQGINELETILNTIDNSSLINSDSLFIDLTLARGLNYYTGTIFEIKAKNVSMGSIGGGGRYDDLTGLFGVPNIPGVGISFGVDRIYDVMEELKLFPETVEQGTKVLFFNLGEEESKIAYSLVQDLRTAGVPTELFHEAQKFDKQFRYAEKKNIPFIIIIGSAEISAKTAVVKDLRSGAQQSIPFENLKNFSFI